MKIKNSKFPSNLRFGFVKSYYHTKKQNPKTVQFIWIVLQHRCLEDGERYNPRCCALVFLN